MKLLLDTCTFIWLTCEPERIPDVVRDALIDPGNTLFLSTVSCWEIVSKWSSNKLTLPEEPTKYIPSRREKLDVHPLSLEESEILRMQDLPDIHRDPIDRLLISQSLYHNMTIVTPDSEIRKYDVSVLW